METEPRHALEAGGRQPPAAQSAVQSPDPSSPPLRAAASVAAGASEVSASLRRSQLKQEPFAPLAGRLAPWAGVWPGLGGFRRFGLRPWRGTPAPMLGAAKATPKATRKVVPGDSETSRFRARENPRQIRAGRYGVPRARGGGECLCTWGWKNKACLCTMISGPVAVAQTPPIASARPRIRLRAARRPGVSAAQGVCSVGSQQGDSEPGTTDGFLV